jgi:hypothetical protein
MPSSRNPGGCFGARRAGAPGTFLRLNTRPHTRKQTLPFGGAKTSCKSTVGRNEPMIKFFKTLFTLGILLSRIEAQDFTQLEPGFAEFPYFNMVHCLITLEVVADKDLAKGTISILSGAYDLAKAYDIEKMHDRVLRRLAVDYTEADVLRLKEYFDSDLYKRLIAGQTDYFDRCAKFGNPFHLKIPEARLKKCSNLYLKLDIPNYDGLIFSEARLLTRHKFLNLITGADKYPVSQKGIKDFRNQLFTGIQKGIGAGQVPPWRLIPYCGQFNGLTDPEFDQILGFAAAPWYHNFAKAVYLGTSDGVYDAQRSILANQ